MVTTVAVLGTGIMGAPMARNIAAGGLAVRAWNRSPEKAEPLAEHGVVVARTAAEACDGADVVVTMLADGPAVEDVVRADPAPLETLAGSAVWAQMSTVGPAWAERLATRADEAGVGFVDAPVLGTRQPAEEGSLVVLAAGDERAVEVALPVFEAVGSSVRRLPAVGDASRLKLVLNGWLVALTAALGEAVAFAEGLGIDPATFLDVIDGGPIGPAYARIKGDAMLAREYPTAFPLELALKDARLVAEAAATAGGPPAVVDAVVALMDRAVASGHGRADMAAVVETLRTG